MEAKKGESFLSLLPPPPSPIKNLVSPIPLGRPDTQANMSKCTKRQVKSHIFPTMRFFLIFVTAVCVLLYIKIYLSVYGCIQVGPITGGL